MIERLPADAVSADVIERINALIEQQNALTVLLSEIKDVLGPTIEGLKNSPIAVMMGLK